MTKQKKALQLALEALENASDIMDTWAQKRQDDAITAIKEALEQTEQEYKHGYADAMNWKVQNYLEHLPSTHEKALQEKNCPKD